MNSTPLDLALAQVRAEVVGAIGAHAPLNSAHEGYAVILEELEELWADVMANKIDASVKEAIQVAAMAIRYIVDMRYKYALGPQLQVKS